MIPGLEPPEIEPEPITPGFALVLTLVVAFLLLVIQALMFQLGLGRAGGAMLGIAALIGFGAAFAIAVPRVPPPPAESLGFRRAPREVWTALIFLVPSLLIASEVDNLLRLLHPLSQDADFEPPPDLTAQLELFVVLVIVLPITQEIFFRGLLQPGVVQAWGKRRGILFVAFLNALAFAAPFGGYVVNLFVSSLVLGIVRECGRSVIPGLVLHLMFGVVGLLATYKAFGIPGFDDMTQPHTPLLWLIPAALLTGVGLRYCRAASEATEQPTDPSDPL